KKIEPARHLEPVVLESFLRSTKAARALVRQASNYDVNPFAKKPLHSIAPVHSWRRPGDYRQARWSSSTSSGSRAGIGGLSQVTSEVPSIFEPKRLRQPSSATPSGSSGHSSINHLGRRGA